MSRATERSGISARDSSSSDVADAEPIPTLETGTPPASPVEAVALMLHGGRDRSHAPTTPNQLTVRRMRPFARSLEAERRDHGLAVWMLRYRMTSASAGP